ncbi:MAG: endonuclease III [Deltaproteobacteria bacterium]|nr:endonuclease III [Deltaproteobacteria bacterium]MBI2228550.1 endonuclease III [Deltaproteobacteria bacterium]MBI2364397.1 endonuclease III [Deltaproteobacteria bacterium]MBI2532014.1 endonuclease III [Deltaproteobacteria bacterium]
MPGKMLFASGVGTERARSAAASRRGVRRRKRETLEEKSTRVNAISARLALTYPDVECPLAHQNTFELLVAVMLSAQCTDAAVNKVTPELFRRYPDAAALSRASTREIEALIRTLGLFRAKAKSLQRCAQQLVDEFEGQVPATMEELTKLAGVGRKTANVILGHAFATPGIAVDTHCKRLSNRLGLTRQQDPTRIERDLNRLLPPEQWTGFSHRLIIHGRRVCHARKPNCGGCALRQWCPSREIAAASSGRRRKRPRRQWASALVRPPS